jgi:uncharacterized protein YukJ
MARGITYGALRGRIDRNEREDGKPTPHLQIRILDHTGQPWRIAANVESQDGSDLVYWIIDPLVGHPILDSLSALPTGFHQQTGDSAHALDFLKHHCST